MKKSWGRSGPPGRFLKWAGGKRQLLPELVPRCPAQFGSYYEPFMGSAALFFALRSEGRLARAHLSDANPHLAQVYQALADDVDAVIAELKTHPYDKDHYYEVRAWDVDTLSPAARAARFLYINRAGFNGLYRENRKGQCNVPFGRYTNPRICNEETLRAAATALRGVSLRQVDFEAAVARAKAGDFVYFDPPYVPLSPTASFTSYSRGGFDEPEQRRLAALFSRLAGRGVQVLLSNSDAPLVHELYGEHRIERVSVRRAINSKADRRGAISEVLVTPS